MQYSITSRDGHSVITVFQDNGLPLVADSDNPNFKAILDAVMDGHHERLDELFAPIRKVIREFTRLSDKVTVKGDQVLFDGQPLHNSISKEILRFVDAGTQEGEPLVKFVERVYANPSEHSRSQMYEWLDRHEFSLSPRGYIIGYKSVRSRNGGDFAYQSITSGSEPVLVDDKEYIGHIPQNIGSLVEIARDKVDDNSGVGCSAGLHVSNYRYASTWTIHDAVLAVEVDPADVVSVPSDSSFEKVRVCRYRVLKVVNEESNSVVWPEDNESLTDVSDDDSWTYDDDSWTYDDDGDFSW